MGSRKNEEGRGWLEWSACRPLTRRGGEISKRPVEIPAGSNVEMSWHVFVGEHHEIYLALLNERCLQDGQPLSDEALARQCRLHLHRGIGYLAAPRTVTAITDLIQLAADEPGER